MSSNDEPDCKDNQKSYFWKLDTIPPELFLHICSFLSAKFIIDVLSQVCQQFKEIIESDTNWRMRIFKRWPKRYPVILPSEDFNWKEACVAREEEYRLWHDATEHMKTYYIKGAHYAVIDVILIIEDGRLCVSGSRDRSWKLWDLNALNEQQPSTSEANSSYETCLLHTRETAHDGWLWSFAYDKANQTLYSGGFDNIIRGWKIDHPDSPASSTYKFSSPVLSLALHEDTLSYGTYQGNVNYLDVRIGTNSICAHKKHRKSVLCMAADEKFIISGSEDGSIVVYNKVAGKVQNTMQLEHFPMSISYGDGLLLLGDLKGYLHYIDPTNEKFELVKSYKSGHDFKITGLQHSLGSVITSSTDKTVQIMEPNVDPMPIAVLRCDSEVTGLSRYNSILASGLANDSISIWFPKEE